MRALLMFMIGVSSLGLGIYAGWVQTQNFEIAADLDQRQRRMELARMWIQDAEARILAAEASIDVEFEPVLAPVTESSEVSPRAVTDESAEELSMVTFAAGVNP